MSLSKVSLFGSIRNEMVMELFLLLPTYSIYCISRAFLCQVFVSVVASRHIFWGSCEESPGQQRSLLGTYPARCCDAILWTAPCATCTFAFHPWWSSPSSGILSWENQILWVRLLACCEMLSFQVAEAMSQERTIRASCLEPLYIEGS